MNLSRVLSIILYCLDRLQKKPRTVSARASSTLKEVRHDDGRETITTAQLALGAD